MCYRFRLEFLLFLLSYLTTACVTEYLQPIIYHLQYKHPYTFSVNDSQELIFILNATDQESAKWPPRITISSENARPEAPLMLVAKHDQQVLSLQLPLIASGHVFTNVSRSLCSLAIDGDNTTNSTTPLIINVSTFSRSINAVTFDILIDFQTDFLLGTNMPHNFTVTPTAPKFFFYRFADQASKPNDDYHTVVLKVQSDSDICMTIGIQNATCPVFDMDEDITFRGYYATVDRLGGITVARHKFPLGFFVVFVAKSSDEQCTGTQTDPSDTVQRLRDGNSRSKNVTVVIQHGITYADYMFAIVVTAAVIVTFIVLFVVGFLFCMRRTLRPRRMDSVITCPTDEQRHEQPNTLSADRVSLDGAEFDVRHADRPLLEQHAVWRLAACSELFLSDMARKDPRLLAHKSNLYLYNVITVAIFYALPVVQLVYTYQTVLNRTGEQDLCYYNFLCANPWNWISDFNHVYSNIGYVSLGALFLWLVYRRERTHGDLAFEREYGIPQHYGMFYAMGVALVMEGVLSASYHVCPNQANFQFDSSFMYVMAVLCIVKLYQNRHPDINATAYSTFMVLAIAIILAMVGILEGTRSFWIGFTTIYVVTCLYMSAQVYYMGCWSIDSGIASRIWHQFQQDLVDGGIFRAVVPSCKARMGLLLIGNALNWCLAFYGFRYLQHNFAIFLLMIFMSNSLLYFLFYIIMKHRHGERINALSWFFLFVSVACAFSAMYYFLRKGISWRKTPAQSRRYNHECSLLRFYDYHDIWHYLSATGMFFTFMMLLTLDDDLSHQHRTQIVVF